MPNKNNIVDISRTPLTPVEIITLAEAKAQLIVTYTDDDTLITGYILKAIKAIENFCNISLQPYTCTLTADLYQEWELPYGPVTAINTVQTRTANSGSGPQQYTGAAGNWLTDGTQFITFIPAGDGGFNPAVPFTGYFQWGPWASRYGYAPGLNRYRIVYTTGWGTDTPDDLKQAILMQVAFLYEHRGEADANRYNWLPGVCEAALVFADKYKRQSWL